MLTVISPLGPMSGVEQCRHVNEVEAASCVPWIHAVALIRAETARAIPLFIQSKNKYDISRWSIRCIA